MPVHRNNLKDIVDAAWGAALKSPRRPTIAYDPLSGSTQLARQFQDNYKLERRHRVFWKGYEGNKEHFGVNELLFDIAVCSVSTTPSLQRQPPTPRVHHRLPLAGRIRIRRQQHARRSS